MKSPKAFTIIYYAAFLFTLVICAYSYNVISEFEIYTNASSIIVYLGILNAILVSIFTIKLCSDKKTLNGNIIIPITYLIFESIVFIICLLYNNIVIYKNTQIYLIENIFISFGFSLFYPFIINIFPTMIRMCSIHSSNKNQAYCYKISQIIQLI